MNNSRSSRSSKASRTVALAGLVVLVGFLIARFSIGPTPSRSNPNRPDPTTAQNDDAERRIRKVSFNFWKELSSEPHPSFAGEVDKSIDSLEFPIHAVEKNWPAGPMVITYEGTAKDAFAIHQALRSAGVPTSSYQMID
ncbi:hypothetical protein EC9_41340 [Rosistilla ulvae]|uniref:Uncharacterized protein n=1 Tax=Rosistilla ulvae TaxID=1930277 RepID=A0A517M4Y4_9BACT|nr:hypothetical protein [Rosistilla ulvae]QDS89932.1 hypothetical protein EC9_41340 [Rosistilla ulvae]